MCSLASYRPDRTKKRVNQIFENYYHQIESARTEKQKLEAIGDLCRRLEIYHVFPDGNQRTIAFALLTKLLIENGFSPAILEYPTLFDGMFTLREIVQQIEQGMIRFKKVSEHYREHPEHPLDFNTLNEGISFSRELPFTSIPSE